MTCVESKSRLLTDGPIRFSLEPFPGMDAMAKRWLDLEQRADCTSFLSWKWVGNWLALDGKEPVVLVGQRSGQTVCLGLLEFRARFRHGVLRSRGLFLNETGDPDQDIIAIENNGLLCEAGLEEHATLAALDYLVGLPDGHPLLGTWDELRMGGVAVELEAAALAHGLRLHTINRRGTAVVDLAALRREGGRYLDHLSANTRYQIRRSIRLYEQRGPLRLDRAQSSEEALAYFDGLKSLHQPYWVARTGKGAFSYPLLVQFHQRFMTTTSINTDYEILRIRCGDDDLGYIYNLVYGRWSGFYLGGFRFEDDNKLKPGMVCFALALQTQLDETPLSQPVDVFDFLAGDQRYKTSLATRQPGLAWFDVQKPRLKLRIEDVARRARAYVIARTADKNVAVQSLR